MKITEIIEALGKSGVVATEDQIGKYLGRKGWSESDVQPQAIAQIANELNSSITKPAASVAPVGSTQSIPTAQPTKTPATAPNAAPKSVPAPKTKASSTTIADSRERLKAAVVSAATIAEETEAEILEMALEGFREDIKVDKEQLAGELRSKWVSDARRTLGEHTNRLAEYREQTRVSGLRLIDEGEIIDVLALPAGA